MEIDGGLLVLLDSEITPLSGIAPVVWHAAAHAIPMEDIVHQIGARLGLPDDYQSAVGAAVQELMARGILEHG